MGPCRRKSSPRTEATSKFWGVSWCKKGRRWVAKYRDADGKLQTIGRFDTQEQAAHAVNAAIRRAGLEGRRNTNPVVDGQLVPRGWGGRSAVVAPDPARAPTAPTSEFWGVRWDKSERRWRASYSDANGKWRFIGLFDTQEAAAHAVNAAIRALPPDVQRRRHTNPVVDGHLVPRARKAPKKRRRDEPAGAAPSTRARRPRRAVSYEEDPDFDL